MPDTGMIDKVREAVAESVKDTGADIPEPSGYARPSVAKPIKEAKPKEAPAEEAKDAKVTEEKPEPAPQSKEEPKPEEAKSEEDDFRATEDELALIDKNPELKKVLELVKRFREDPDYY